MGDRLLRYMADQAQPVRLYSPNPDAPQWSGLPATEEPRAPFSSRLWNAVKNAPGQLWGMLPAEARKAYTSGFNAAVDMSTPASVRDYTNSAQDTARSAMQGDGWGTATNALATVNAALGAIPVAGMGVTLARKGAQEVGQAVGKEAGNVIRAYHGSPHSFDRFDMSRIGTGEGKQAEGMGLYFAENPKVAERYRDRLSPEGHQGNVYEVKIHASPDEFVDWSAPLQNQSDAVRNWFSSRGITEGFAGQQSGAELLMAERGAMGDKAVAESMKAAGIPGIKYLDAGSRTAGDGSRNYVVFDDSLIEILRKYGLLPFAGAAGYAALPNDAAPEAR